MKDLYVPKLVTGEWSSANAFTEIQSGSDFTLIESKAERQEDGTYLINAVKPFVPYGEHNLTNNIVYFVLTRAEMVDGNDGLTLFLVPKKIPDDDGDIKASDINNMRCEKIANTMGFRGVPTCEMHFENSKGFLIGEVGKGLTELFVMMNENRILVSSQSLGVAETAAQFAKGYAKFRVQGHKEIGGIRRQVTISEHPDVMRMILKSDAWLQGLRGVLFSTGMLMDNIQFDKNDVEKSKRRVALMGPVLKALTSNMAIDIALRSQSIMGARGYLEEGQMSQFIRDIRVTQIYEGSNGIQALQFMNARLEGDGAMIEYLDDERDYVESGVEVANKLFQDEFIVPYSDALSKLNEFVIEKLENVVLRVAKSVW